MQILENGGRICATVDQIYEEMLYPPNDRSPNDQKIKKSTVADAVVPIEEWEESNPPSQADAQSLCHTEMMQAAGEGEASSLQTIRAIGKAVTLEMQFENKFSTNNLWRKMRVDHPHLILPAI